MKRQKSNPVLMRVEMIVELDGSLWNFKDKDESDWFNNNVMRAEQLYFHSNEIGDSIGEIKSVKCKIIQK